MKRFKYFVGWAIIFGLFLASPAVPLAASSGETADSSSQASTETTASSTEDSSESGQISFSVVGHLPENQINTQDEFFNLRLAAGEQQTISVGVTNHSNREMTYQVSVNQAYTNTRGLIDYTQAADSARNDYPYPIGEIVDFENEVTVPANETVDFPLTITMPAEEFDGEILAAIQITQSQEGSADQGYALGLRLTENDNPVVHELNLIDIVPAAANNRPSVVATLENPTMASYSQLSYHGEIYDASTGELVRSSDSDANLQMAPSSTFDFVIDWEQEPLMAGDYRLVLTVSDNTDSDWEFEQEFSISQEQADEINGMTLVTSQASGLPIWGFIFTGIGLALLLTLGIQAYKRRRRKKLAAARRQAKQQQNKQQQQKSQGKSAAKAKKK
ncbi:DUF916 and DUF3324 domain-containing protein [Enterococcus sp. LJL90]